MCFEPDEPDWCVEHGYEHMRKRSVFDKVSYCAACEDERRVTARHEYDSPGDRRTIAAFHQEATQ